MSCLRVVLLILSVTFAANVNAGTKPDLKAFAVQTLDIWNQALNSKDVATFSGLFTFDAVLLAPGGESAAGVQEIYSYVDTLVNAHEIQNHEIKVKRVGINEDRIFVTGKWTAEKNINGVHEGDLVAILEKQYDGSWRTSFVKWE